MYKDIQDLHIITSYNILYKTIKSNKSLIKLAVASMIQIYVMQTTTPERQYSLGWFIIFLHVSEKRHCLGLILIFQGLFCVNSLRR